MAPWLASLLKPSSKAQHWLEKYLFEVKEFQTFATCFYDSVATTVMHNNENQYQQLIAKSNAGGSTNFVSVF